ncbi:MAG: dTMP kinase [Nitrospirae bacterium]|nr:MAG: dTMP kinase [Nitrospirota bacterium]
MKGLFITFEGIEGSGKTTMVRMLNEYLTDKGYQVIATYEPGDHPLGPDIRKLLLSPPVSPGLMGELLLYMADRAEHLEKVIMPALKEGKIVLCDRFTDSTLAYQGYARGGDIDTIKTLNKLVTGNLRPQRTYLLDLSPEEGLKRNSTAKKTDRFERESLEFHKRVREGFLQIASEEPERFKIIDSHKNLDEVFSEIKEDVEGLL